MADEYICNYCAVGDHIVETIKDGETTRRVYPCARSDRRSPDGLKRCVCRLCVKKRTGSGDNRIDE